MAPSERLRREMMMERDGGFATYSSLLLKVASSYVLGSCAFERLGILEHLGRRISFREPSVLT